MSEIVGQLINGSDVESKVADRVDLIAPYNGSKVAEIETCSTEVLNDGIRVARAASSRLRNEPAHTRIQRLHRIARKIDESGEIIAQTLVQTIGKPVRSARVEVERSADVFRLCASELPRFTARSIREDAMAQGVGLWTSTTYEPMGVAGLITPFNAPLNLLSQKLAPAIAAGNSVIVKPAPEAALATKRLMEVISPVIPNDLVSVVHGGPEFTQQFAASDGVDVISLTGGLEAGRAVSAAAGVKPVWLELGSISPNLVFSDADIQLAAEKIALAAYGASGQQCISAQRVIVEQDIYDEFEEEFIKASKKLKIGDPADDSVDLGPMISIAAADRVRNLITDAVHRGADMLIDGRTASETRGGDALVGPTLLANVPPEADIANQEVFGPVSVLECCVNPEDGVAMANAQGGLLQAACFTTDLKTALFSAKHINSGTVWVNEATRFRLDHAPFGGTGDSGRGREGPRYAMEQFSQVKIIGMR